MASTAKEDTKENFIAVVVLTILSIVYLYILYTPDDQSVKPFLERRFVIPEDTEATFEKFLQSHTTDGKSSEEDRWGKENNGLTDDFYFKPPGYSDKQSSVSEYDHSPNVPSEKYLCKESWVTIRAEANYKYLWLFGNSDLKLSATASQETPLHLRSFKMTPVFSDCSEGGYVTLQSVDGEKENSYVYMNAVSDRSESKGGWFVQQMHISPQYLKNDYRYHFLFEEGGFILNRGGMAFVNVRFEEDGNVAGGSTNDWDKTQVAGREYGAMMNYIFLNDSDIKESLKIEEKEIMLAKKQDEKEIALIRSFPESSEKRVISFGLYGTLPKYTKGAIRNVELSKIYFPGWVCRFYVASDVPKDIISQLKELGAEIEHIPDGEFFFLQ